MMTSEAGAVVQDQVYYPWGQVWSNAGNQYDTRFASLGKRDDENPLDPTPFRMYASSQGRWLSPDPLGGDITNPQSLNRYAYVKKQSYNSNRPEGAGSLPGMSVYCEG